MTENASLLAQIEELAAKVPTKRWTSSFRKRGQEIWFGGEDCGTWSFGTKERQFYTGGRAYDPKEKRLTNDEVSLLVTLRNNLPAIITALRADQRCAELEAENARLRDASIALRDDLLMRAEIDRRDGTKIVDASNSVWIRFNKALDNRDG